ncbi:penicillin-binding protein activator [Sphingomicrobium sediminis]|uniref:Penicillin-binding protein activator n=1 Tax=Sphingomicrobium sediminis TaxID=2950949 RepID=A0A9X2J1F0_9SPHN|nr:penicillin-binding protein activator [Sphingomicrobium sediminis]MCM8557183.1 penicillin-binding protein activator [Sphingomicrobium sediminis]
MRDQRDMKEAASQALSKFKWIAAGAAMLALGACESAPGGGVETAPPVVEDDTGGDDATAQPGVQNGVAVLVPLSGDNAAIGRSIANAASMALLDTEEESLKITIYDTAASGGAEVAVTQALAEGNKLILGPLRGENVTRIAPYARRADVPVIAFSNDESVAGNGVYIMGFTPTQSIRRSVDYAADQGADVFAGLAPNGVYGQRSVQVFLRAVEANGGRVARLETYDRRRSEVEAAARRVASVEDVDMVLIADSASIAEIAAPSLQLSGDLMGTELWASTENLGRVAGMRGAIFAAVPDAQFDRFVQRYRARYNSSPYRLSSLGYDSVLLAVRLARQWPAGGDFPARELTDDGGFGGVDGIFRFGSDGIAERALEVRRVTASGTEIVSPASTRFDD